MPTRAEMLNDEQRQAKDKILAWLRDPQADPYFLLKGYAGTGKTFLVRAVTDEFKGRMVFTAPTNKATKVLKETMTDDGYKPQTATIYSLLGLKLEANGEVKELSTPDPDQVDLTDYRCVVVDEGSMVNEVIMKEIRQAQKLSGVKFLFMGDPAQLPPVGEQRSVIWNIENNFELTKVMRYDNQILTLATSVRQIVDHPAPRLPLLQVSDNDEKGGVWSLDSATWLRTIIKHAQAGDFLKVNGTKAIAWRNVRVDSLNAVIRQHSLEGSSQAPWITGDRVIFTQPAFDIDGETKLASTDEEGTVEAVVEDWHPLYSEFKIWRITICTDDNKLIVARVIHESMRSVLDRKLEAIAQEAKKPGGGRKWRQFWDLKDSFHALRHSYAITAHRSQGSTYERVFADWRDILINRNRQEAYRCLYVACTRAKKELYLG